ncbi:MAG: Ran GTPase-activating protein (RanGAP) involved in mRNA processing and transport, partial [Myxococcota bacterium]
ERNLQLTTLLSASPVSWGRLTTLLDDWPDEEGLALAIQHAEAGLGGLSDARRSAPAQWWRGVVKRKCDSRRVKRRGEKGHPALVLARELMLYEQRLTDKAMSRLAECPTLSRITRLSLGKNRITGEGLTVLLAAGWPLEVLGFTENPLGDAGARVLAESTHLDGLKELSLGSAGIGSQGATALAEARHFHALTTLSLRKNPIGDVGAAALARAGHISTLFQLILLDCDIGDPGAQALGAAEQLKGMFSLDLRNNRIGDVGAVALAGSPFLHGTRKSVSLMLSDNQIGDVGAMAVFEASTDPSFSMANNRIGDAAVRAMAQSPALQRLNSIDLVGNPISDEAAAVLGRAFQEVHPGKLADLGRKWYRGQ